MGLFCKYMKTHTVMNALLNVDSQEVTVVGLYL